MKLLIAGVGYGNLRDYSFGPVMIQRMLELQFPSFVEIEDLSYHPISVLHKLRDTAYDKIIFITAVARGRYPGSVERYHPSNELRDSDTIRNSINEGVTGVISLDNLLNMARFYNALPQDVVVMEVEPGEETYGAGFSPAVEKASEVVMEMVQEELSSRYQNHAAEVKTS